MAENVAKAEFLNYLLNAKHNVEKQPSPIISSQVTALNAPDAFKDFDADFSVVHLESWLKKLEDQLPLNDAVLNDLAFGILYSSESFIKMLRNKNIEFTKVAELYRNQFNENKKYLVEFNKKDGGKININAPAHIVTRFPPEPSGYLHIGHAKAAILNQMMAKNGRLIVRFDDTNPEKEDESFEKAILEDLSLLKIVDYKITHSSDHFDLIFECAIKLIKEGKAYADDTIVDVMRQQRAEGIASKNRDTDSETNLRLFKEMNDGVHSEFCLRAKINMSDPNKAMRDPVIYRVVNKPHHRTGEKYKIYPTYDLAVPIIDSIEGVTLSLRSNEFRDRNSQYYWFIEALKLENKPKIHDFSRLCFDNTVVSKRKMKFYVEKKFVSGWDDPRLCTLRGLKRQGMDMEALIEYIRLQGASQKSSVNSWDKIWAINKKIIDSKSARFSAVPLDNAVACVIEGYFGPEKLEVSKHKKIVDLGKKTVFFSDEILLAQEDAAVLEKDEEFTFMNWGNAIVLEKNVEDGIVKNLKIKLHLDGDFKTTKNKITWISRKGSVLVKFYEYGNLQNDIESDDLAEQFNKDSKKEQWYFVEDAIKDVMIGDFVQFERIGFYYCDKAMEFNLIPFTKQKRSY